MNTKLIIAVLWLLATTVFPSNAYAEEPQPPAINCETPLGSSIDLGVASESMSEKEIGAVMEALEKRGCVDKSSKNLPTIKISRAVDKYLNYSQAITTTTNFKTTVGVVVGEKECSASVETSNTILILPLLGKVSSTESTTGQRMSVAIIKAVVGCR